MIYCEAFTGTIRIPSPRPPSPSFGLKTRGRSHPLAGAGAISDDIDDGDDNDGHSLGAALLIENVTDGSFYSTTAATSATITMRQKPSAFGKAAIGKKNKRASSNGSRNSAAASSKRNTTTTTKILNHNATPQTQHTATTSSSNTSTSTALRTAMSTQQVTKRRNLAIQALTQHLYLPRDATISILNRHPRLYTHLFNLNDRLSYLLHDLHLTRTTLKKMLLHHPRLMEKVFLDSEVNIASTMQVLEKEIGLDREDVIQMQLQKGVTSVLSYPRSELRKRILVYKKDLGYGEDEMRDMVRRDPRMLQTNSIKVKKLLKILREELGIGSGDVKEMLQKEILLLTYDAEKNIRPTIQYLKNGPVGRCLGMVERKGESTLLDNQTVEEKEELIRGRVKTLIMGHPKVLSCSLERNLKPTVEFFWGSNCTSSTSVVGLTDYEFGKVLYRRGGSLLEANVERTLSKKVNFLREHFGLDVGEECKDGDGDVDNAADDDYSLVDKVQMWNGCKVEIPLPRSLLVPKKDENGVSEPKSSLTPYESKRLLAQMIATTPDILTLSIDTNLKPKFDFFANILKLETDELRYIMLKRPQLLSLSLDRNILPKIDFFLKERRPTALSVLNGQESYDGGLGMTLKEVRNWIVRHPQILTFSLEKRIRPRVVDIVRYNLQVGDEEGDAPLNCISRGEQSWKQWIQSNVV